MLLPIKSKNPPESFPYVTCALIAANVIVFALTRDGAQIHTEVVDQYAVSASNLSVFRLFTSMFLHADPFHILGNMWFLYLFGFAVEGRLRHLKFLSVYLLSGVAGALLQLWTFGDAYRDVPCLGASGAIMGLLGAALYLFPFAKMDFFYGWYMSYGVTTWPMYGVCGYYVGFDVLMALLSRGGGGVAHLAHVGGALGGFVFCAALRPKRDSEAVSEAKATLSEAKDLSALSQTELSAMISCTPNDPKLLLHWALKAVRDGRTRPECLQAFMQHMPSVVSAQPPADVAAAIMGLASLGTPMPPRALHETASRLEKSGEPSTAVRLYDAVLRSPYATPEDREGALLRSAVLFEARLSNKEAARNYYQALLQQYPMSAMADQARLALARLN